VGESVRVRLNADVVQHSHPVAHPEDERVHDRVVVKNEQLHPRIPLVAGYRRWQITSTRE
jgi:hypothetical protein